MLGFLQDVAEVLSKEYRHKIDIAYEGVGGPLRDAVLENLSPAGIVLAVGYISEYPHTRCVWAIIYSDQILKAHALLSSLVGNGIG